MPHTSAGVPSAVGHHKLYNSYGLEDPGLEPRWERDFPYPPRLVPMPTQPPVQWVLGLPGVKQQECGIVYPLPCSTKVSLLPLCAFMVYYELKFTWTFNPFQPRDAIWHYAFPLFLICMPFAQWFQQSSQHTALTFLRLAGYADVTQHTNKEASSCMFCRRGGKCL